MEADEAAHSLTKEVGQHLLENEEGQAKEEDCRAAIIDQEGELCYFLTLESQKTLAKSSKNKFQLFSTVVH